jgi:dipeptidyl aminopeptidase/acylaminoacyl peptidase
LEPVVRSLKVQVLIAHGEEDESVPLRHGEALFSWSKANNPQSELFLIPEASHTLNTKHPFAGPTLQLETFLDKAKSWIEKIAH